MKRWLANLASFGVKECTPAGCAAQGSGEGDRWNGQEICLELWIVGNGWRAFMGPPRPVGRGRLRGQSGEGSRGSGRAGRAHPVLLS